MASKSSDENMGFERLIESAQGITAVYLNIVKGQLYRFGYKWTYRVQECVLQIWFTQKLYGSEVNSAECYRKILKEKQ